MSTMTLKKTAYGPHTEAKEKVSWKEKFQNYISENSAVIVSGLMMLNGNTNAYSVYRMLSK